jgi:hypothetical protein
MEQRDATATPNDESPYETGDSDADPNYSLSDNSYSDSSDSYSSSLHEVNDSALNEPQNVDLTTERKNRNQRAEKEKESCHLIGKEIKPNCYEIQDTYTVPLKEALKYPKGRYVPLLGPIVDCNIFVCSPSRKHLIFQKISV